jgi:CrcB protein
MIAKNPAQGRSHPAALAFFRMFVYMKAYLLVFVGGGLGSLLRYLAGRWLPATVNGAPFPTAILLVNVVASALLSAVVGWTLARSANDDMRLLIGVGFCGGLSTFSSFSNDTVVLLQNGRTGVAFLNIILNVVLCLLASTSGLLIGQKL